MLQKCLENMKKCIKKDPSKCSWTPYLPKIFSIFPPERQFLHYFYPKNTLKKGLPRMHLSPNFQKFFQPGPRIVARRRRRSAKQVFAGYAPPKPPAHISNPFGTRQYQSHPPPQAPWCRETTTSSTVDWWRKFYSLFLPADWLSPQ